MNCVKNVDFFLSIKMLRFLFGALLFFVISVNSLETYDFIVVGSGAGGSTITRRLVEKGRFKVLLIESGGMPREGHEVPVRASEFLGDAGVTFRLQSIPQRNAALRNKGVVPIIAGKMLGGTTSLNYMFFSRGSPQDWNHYAEVAGDDSWNYYNMLKYFKRSETYMGDFPSSQLHGNDGPITVSRPRYAPGLDYWLKAGTELGYNVTDPNGFENIGFSPIEFSKRNGRRASSYNGYLEPVRNMSNLEIWTNTNVTQVIFEGKRAVGVRYVSNANNAFTENTVYASKEIIICAGGYYSPVILQRSGIGPRQVLQSAKIPLLADLPTGANLDVHMVTNLNFVVNNASVVFNETKELTPKNWEIFTKFGEGPYTNTRGATAQAMMTSSVARAEGRADWPDIQLILSHSVIPYFGEGLVRNQIKDGEVPISTAVFLGRPKSHGSVKVNPDNVLGIPLVDFNYLGDERDLQVLLDGIQEAFRVIEGTQAYSSLQPRFIPLPLPACDNFTMKSRDYWTCYIKQQTPSACHPTGTNKMGKRNDPTAVVDTRLRVIGIKGLRVADASVMPSIVNMNPQAAVYGIAEKAADMILQEWEFPRGRHSS